MGEMDLNSKRLSVGLGKNLLLLTSGLLSLLLAESKMRLESGILRLRMGVKYLL